MSFDLNAFKSHLQYVADKVSSNPTDFREPIPWKTQGTLEESYRGMGAINEQVSGGIPVNIVPGTFATKRRPAGGTSLRGIAQPSRGRNRGRRSKGIENALIGLISSLSKKKKWNG